MEATEKIEKWLADNNYALWTYHTLHTCGMPGGAGVLVATEWTPIDGIHALKVTPTEVYQVTLKIPYNYNDWQVRSCHPYSSPESLKKILDSLIKQAVGCWK